MKIRSQVSCVSLSALAVVSWASVSDADLLPSSEDGVWRFVDEMPEATRGSEPWIRPEAGLTLMLSDAVAERVLGKAPLEFDESRRSSVVMSLPTPEGEFNEFAFVETQVMHPDLAAKFPEIRTYLGTSLDVPGEVARVTLTPAGFDAQILGPNGAYYVDRASRIDDGVYNVYARDGYTRPAEQIQGSSCLCGAEHDAHSDHARPTAGEVSRSARVGEQLRTYRLAVSTTGEYTSFHGGTVAGAQAAIVTAINRVTGIYEREVAVRMQLVPNNDQLIYTDAGSDPFTNNSAVSLLNENQPVVDGIIGSANYDVGHNFSTGGGGVASLGVVCVNGSKARGITGLPSPIGDPFYVDFVAHELGHQFRANHTFNGVNGSCSGGNRNGSTAYEPGSATTIMGYAGICGADDLQSNSDAIFHSISFDEIRAFVTTGAAAGCGVLTSTGNLPPVVDAGPGYTIPGRTPFTLTATGSDPDGQAVTFAWEQRDLGAAQALAETDNGSSPLFRSFEPTASPSRTFPRIARVLSGVADPAEELPLLSRSMTMRVTARDNQAGGGGVAFDETTITVVGGAGPFRVTSPSGGDLVGGVVTVNWDVNDTAASPINATNVEILLSTDNGQTFPTVLASSTPNDGSHAVSLPATGAGLARIMIRPTNNVFFAISEAFAIEQQAVSIALNTSIPRVVEPGSVTQFEVIALSGTETIIPSTVSVFASTDGVNYVQTVLTPVGQDEYAGSFNAPLCEQTLSLYFSAESSAGTTALFPANAPTEVIEVTSGSQLTGFEDNFQADLGWQVSSSATDGQWERGVPVDGDRGDPSVDADGSGECYVTDNVAGNSDVDNGSTTLTSPQFDTTGGATISWSYWLNDIPGGVLGVEDGLSVEYSTDGSNWTVVASYNSASASWRSDSYVVEAPGSSTSQIRFIASDDSPGDVVEAGVDAVSVASFRCVDVVDPCPADVNGSGAVDIEDLLQVLREFGVSAFGDADGDGDTDIEDLLEVLREFGSTC